MKNSSKKANNISWNFYSNELIKYYDLWYFKF